MAEDLREYMAKLGVRTVDELVGRTDLLKVKAAPAGSRAGEMDLTALLQQEGHTVTPGPWPGALVVEFAGSPAASAAFKKGLFHVQGLASQFAALCVDAQPGQQVLDLCAAPGGKSLTLAEAMQDKGQLVSGEFVPARVPLLQQAFDRCGIVCTQPAGDKEKESFGRQWDQRVELMRDVIIAFRNTVHCVLGGWQQLDLLRAHAGDAAAQAAAGPPRRAFYGLPHPEHRGGRQRERVCRHDAEPPRRPLFVAARPRHRD